MPKPSASRRSCLIVLLLALVIAGVGIWLLTDFVATPSTGTMPPRPGNNV
jgi:hypothetical protein